MMRQGLRDFLESLSGKLVSEGKVITAQSPSLVESIEEARWELNAARSYFETVTDPQLIDHAIYMLEAAEKKYTYLIRKARDAGLTIQIPNTVQVSQTKMIR